MSSKYLLAPVIGAMSLFLAGPATAQERTEVRFSDLDLRTDVGRQILDRRIRGAVRFVCATRFSPGKEDLQGTIERRRCLDETLPAAFRQRDAVLATYQDGGSVELAVITINVRSDS